MDIQIMESERFLYLDKPSEITCEEIFSSYPSLYPLHRLDTNTTGILVLGKSKEAANYFRIHKKDTQKFYLCVVNGAFPKDLMTQEFDILVQKPKVLVKKTPESLHCLHQIKRLTRNDKFSALVVKLITGRKHQIRAGLKALNHSIIGDLKYGNGKHFKRQALHAFAIQIPGDVFVHAQVPKDFQSALNSFCNISPSELDKKLIDALSNFT